LTRRLVRQPVGEEGSGSAARRSPRFRESLKDEKSVWWLRRIRGRRSIEERFNLILQHGLSQGDSGFENSADAREISGLGETSGRRQSGLEQAHFSEVRAFTGMGLDSTKLMSIKERYWKWRRRASEKSPERADCTRRVISAGISLEATEIRPRPPREIRGSVKESSPERTRKSLENEIEDGAHLEMLPEASLMPTMFLIWERRRTVAGSMLTPVRP